MEIHEAKPRQGTTVEDLYSMIRDRITEGTYSPGFKLSQEALAAELNVSRTPLREALQRLERDGLVVAHKNRGMNVAPLIHSDTEQSYAMRLLIEPPAVAATAEKLTDEELAKMLAVVDAMEASKNNSRQFQEAHQAFHRLTYSHFPLEFKETVERLDLQTYRHQRVHFSLPRVPNDVIQIDRDIVQAIKDGDFNLVRRAEEFHLIDSALGLMLDADENHRFDPLLVALKGRQIWLEHHPDGRVSRPAKIRWISGEELNPPPRRTQNLILMPPF